MIFCILLFARLFSYNFIFFSIFSHFFSLVFYYFTGKIIIQKNRKKQKIKLCCLFPATFYCMIWVSVYTQKDYELFMILLLLKRRLWVRIWNLEILILRELLCKYWSLCVRVFEYLCFLFGCFIMCVSCHYVLLNVYHIVIWSYIIVYCVKLCHITWYFKIQMSTFLFQRFNSANTYNKT